MCEFANACAREAPCLSRGKTNVNVFGIFSRRSPGGPAEHHHPRHLGAHHTTPRPQRCRNALAHALAQQHPQPQPAPPVAAQGKPRGSRARVGRALRKGLASGGISLAISRRGALAGGAGRVVWTPVIRSDSRCYVEAGKSP